MKKILITGATGNIGTELIRYLYKGNTPNQIIAGVRNVEKAKRFFKEYQNLEIAYFDFEDPQSFEGALEGINRVFLLRPPHISNVDKYFKPLIECIQKASINEIVFLSVQGAEKSKVIPHNKIERLINEKGLDHIFMRPSYFMQNLTTTLLKDIQTKREIILPAGKAKFNWVDIQNIGEVGAILLDKFVDHKNKAFEITGLENESFEKATQLINEQIENPIEYRPVSPFSFYRIKNKQGVKKGMIIVMILLHFLPRFQKAPSISDAYSKITGKEPTDLRTYIKREKSKFELSISS